MNKRVKTQNRRDAVKRAAKRRRQREQEARSSVPGSQKKRRRRPSAQLDHGSNPKGRAKAREGEKAMERERKAEDVCPSCGLGSGLYRDHVRQELHCDNCGWSEGHPEGTVAPDTIRH